MEQGQLLRLDTTGKAEFIFHLAGLLAGRQQPPPLLTAQGMGGEHQGDAQSPLQLGTHVAGIGVVGMNPIGAAILG